MTDKEFLSYNQQMRKLRDDKYILCEGSKDKSVLVRMGYFNLVNGYKTPFTCGLDANKKHKYLPGTSINHFYRLKQFDDSLRMILLKYITQVEEEVRTLTGYKFDQCNNLGKTTWFDTSAYDNTKSLQDRMKTISSAYGELCTSRLEYVKFYMDNHKSIPTWIMIKVVNFSTFISIVEYSKKEVTHSICELYDMKDQNGHYEVKLLLGSLHWMRKVRNACAHNERIYCINEGTGKNGRIIEKCFRSLGKSYGHNSEKRIMDLLIYFKYYLPQKEFDVLIIDVYNMLVELEKSLPQNAFANVRGQMGIKDLKDLETLKNLPKKRIEYNRFEARLK